MKGLRDLSICTSIAILLLCCMSLSTLASEGNQDEEKVYTIAEPASVGPSSVKGLPKELKRGNYILSSFEVLDLSLGALVRMKDKVDRIRFWVGGDIGYVTAKKSGYLIGHLGKSASWYGRIEEFEGSLRIKYDFDNGDARGKIKVGDGLLADQRWFVFSLEPNGKWGFPWIVEMDMKKEIDDANREYEEMTNPGRDYIINKKKSKKKKSIKSKGARVRPELMGSVL